MSARQPFIGAMMLALSLRLDVEEERAPVTQAQASRSSAQEQSSTPAGIITSHVSISVLNGIVRGTPCRSIPFHHPLGR